MSNKTLKPLALVYFFITAVFLVYAEKSCLDYSNHKYNSKNVMKALKNVNSKKDLYTIFNEDTKPYFGCMEEDRNLLYLLNDFQSVIASGISDKTLNVFINFLNDNANDKKYRISTIKGSILVIIISSDIYSSKQKEFAVRALNYLPDSFKLRDLEDYFQKPKNQDTPLFRQYVKWCLERRYTPILIKLFDKLNLREQKALVSNIDPITESEKKTQSAFLKRVSTSGKKDEKVARLARERLKYLENKDMKLLNAILNARNSEKLKELLKKHQENKFLYEIIENALMNGGSYTTRKAILEYLSENCVNDSTKIGNILYKVVISPSDKFPYDLKKMALSQDAFQYNWIYREKLCDYFSKKGKGIEKSPLIDKFIDMVLNDSDEKESMKFISAIFDFLISDRRYEVVKKLKLDDDGQLSIQFEFLRRILTDKKYSETLKKLAREKLSKLESNKKKFDERMRPKTMEEQVLQCVAGFERLIEIKIFKPSKAVRKFSAGDKKMIGMLFQDVNRVLESYEKVGKVGKATMKKARGKIQTLRKRVDELLSDNTKSRHVKK